MRRDHARVEEQRRAGDDALVAVVGRAPSSLVNSTNGVERLRRHVVRVAAEPRFRTATHRVVLDEEVDLDVAAGDRPAVAVAATTSFA